MPKLLPPLFVYVCLLVATASAPAAAQMQVELAKQYYDQGEYEKAAELYDELAKAQPARNRIECLRDCLLRKKLLDRV